MSSGKEQWSDRPEKTSPRSYIVRSSFLLMLRTKIFMKIFTVTVPGLLEVKRIFTVVSSKILGRLISSSNLKNHSNRFNSSSNLLTVIGSIRVRRFNTKVALRNSRKSWKENEDFAPPFQIAELHKSFQGSQLTDRSYEDLRRKCPG
jgi:hypothetical protein